MTAKLNPKITVGDSPIDGKGLFAKAPFKKGEKFRISSNQSPSVIMSDKELEAYKKTVKHWDAVYLGNGTHRVGLTSRDEDPSNYGNHSCNPNIVPDGHSVVALRSISVGEELTIDYAQFSPIGWEMSCNCGASVCVGTVKGVKE